MLMRKANMQKCVDTVVLARFKYFPQKMRLANQILIFYVERHDMETLFHEERLKAITSENFRIGDIQFC